jgi:hypothetical protein
MTAATYSGFNRQIIRSVKVTHRCHRPVQPGDPVRRGFSAQALPSLEYWMPRFRGA